MKIFNVLFVTVLTGLLLLSRIEAQVIIYDAVEGTVGNQEFGGSLGMDFEVNSDIVVTDLGAFDSGSDGLFLPIMVEIWIRDGDSGIEVIASEAFDFDDGATLEGGHRFKALNNPVALEPGSYTIVAYGYGAGEPNVNASGQPAADFGMSTNDAGGAITFVGGSRWGDAGSFPPNNDGGPEQRYGAGSFKVGSEDEDEDEMPDAWEIANGLDPEDAEDAGRDADNDGLNNLKEFQLGLDPNSDDTDEDGAKDGFEYDNDSDPNNPDSDDDGLTDGEEFTGGTDPMDPDTDGDGFRDGFEIANDSDPNDSNSVPEIKGGPGVIVYDAIEGTVGNQNFAGALGMDFEVNSAITVSELGAFDSGSDGLFLPIKVELWSREGDSGIEILAELNFDENNEGILEGGHRFKKLNEPIFLDSGSYTIVATGYGAGEPNVNASGQPAENFGLTTDNLGEAITFVGGSRWGDAGAFPPNLDGGPEQRYGAGSFKVIVDDEDEDGMPDLWEEANGLDPELAEDAEEDPDNDGLSNLAEFEAGLNPKVADTDEDDVDDGTEIDNETDPLNPDTDDDGLSDGAEVTAGTDPLNPDTDDDGSKDGQEVAKGTDPNDSNSFPASQFAGELAYKVEQGTVGNQNYTGALGMDFIVEETIRVFELGAFDSGSDGLSRPITVSMWSRDDLGTPEDVNDDSGIDILAQIEFTPGNEGDLRDGHRIIALEDELVLEPGAYTIVASGYGSGEPNGNIGVGADIAEKMSMTEDPIITFIGGSRFGNDTVAFPGTPDGGPENRYAAGTFAFEILASPLRFTNISYDSLQGETTLTWSSIPNRIYAIDESIDLITWEELDDSLASEGMSTSFTIDTFPGKSFFRIRLQE
ncbi:MAG: hypothetical protein OSB44_02405 [Verrucomicrobiales bacterium]|nr:hypothetical protein [Verrucomicrobiales bacterium]